MLSFFSPNKKNKNPKLSDCPPQNLCDVCNDLTVCVKELAGDPEICQRLREMGFCEETAVKKVSHSGAVIACVNGCKIIVSESLAKKIMVEDIHLSGGAVMQVMLSQLEAGQKAKVSDFVDESDAAQRIEEMGVTPGEEVEMIRSAPMGDPLEIKVRGYLLSLRKDEADLVRVIVE